MMGDGVKHGKWKKTFVCAEIDLFPRNGDMKYEQKYFGKLQLPKNHGKNGAEKNIEN